MDSKSIQCGFESHPGYRIGAVSGRHQTRFMYSDDVRRQALAALTDGASLNATSNDLGIARSTLRQWRDRPRAAHPSACIRCGDEATLPPESSYAYVLGQYLGDGCISAHPKGVFALRIACCDAYPGVMRYEYPRYFFTNTSTDIMGLCQWALGLLDLHWTMTGSKNLSVARMADVAVLDVHVGPKG